MKKIDYTVTESAINSPYREESKLPPSMISVSFDQLKEAIEKVGNSAHRVSEYLMEHTNEMY